MAGRRPCKGLPGSLGQCAPMFFRRFLSSALLLTGLAVAAGAVEEVWASGYFSNKVGEKYEAQDIVAAFCPQYGVSKNVLEIYVFGRKLNMAERKGFESNLPQIRESLLASALGKTDKSAVPTYLQYPRVEYQFHFQDMPKELSANKVTAGAVTYVPKPGSLDSHGLPIQVSFNYSGGKSRTVTKMSPNFRLKLGGLVKEGELVNFESQLKSNKDGFVDDFAVVAASKLVIRNL